MGLNEHLTAEQAAAFVIGETPEDEIIAIGDHLASCDRCCGLVSVNDNLQARITAQLVSAISGSEHLSPDEICDYVNEALNDEARSALKAHLYKCDLCQKAVNDLSSFTVTIANYEPLPAVATRKFGDLPIENWLRGIFSPVNLRIAVSTAVLLLIVGVVAIKVRHAADTLVKQNPTVLPFAKTTGHTESPAAAEVASNDNSGADAIDNDGNILLDGKVVTLEPIALESGFVDGSEPDSVRGSDTGALRLLTPHRTVALSLRPVFRWLPSAQPSIYFVKIYDKHGPVATSSPIETTTWTPPAPLPAGKQLSWRVEADIVSGGTVETPSIDKPADPFITLSSSSYQDLNTLSAHEPGNHLKLGIKFALAGLYDNARLQIAAYVARHPEDLHAQRLLKRLQALTTEN